MHESWYFGYSIAFTECGLLALILFEGVKFANKKPPFQFQGSVYFWEYAAKFFNVFQNKITYDRSYD